MLVRYLGELVARAMLALRNHPVVLILNWISVTVLPSEEQLWDAVKRLALFVPFIVYHEYKQYNLKKQLYNQTWVHTYQRRKAEYLALQQDRKSSSDSLKQINGWPRIQSDNKYGIIKTVGMNKLQQEIGINDKTVQTDCYRSEYLAKEISSWKQPSQMSSDVIPTSEAKRLKTIDSNRPSVESQDIKIVDLFRDAKGMMVSLQTIVVQYFEVVTKKTPTGEASELPFHVPRMIDSEPEGLIVGNTGLKRPSRARSPCFKAGSRKVRSKREHDTLNETERKWLSILERANRMKKERMARMKEREMQKALKKENEGKLALVRRRATIAKIREQNKRILMGQGEPQSNEGGICRMIDVEKNPLLSMSADKEPAVVPSRNALAIPSNEISDSAMSQYNTKPLDTCVPVHRTTNTSGNNDLPKSVEKTWPTNLISTLTLKYYDLVTSMNNSAKPTVSNTSRSSADQVKTTASKFEKLDVKATGRLESRSSLVEEQVKANEFTSETGHLDSPGERTNQSRVIIKRGRRRLKKNNEADTSSPHSTVSANKPIPISETDAKESLFKLKVIQRTDERLKSLQSLDSMKNDNGPGGDHLISNADEQRDVVQRLPFDGFSAETKLADFKVGESSSQIVMTSVHVNAETSKNRETLENQIARNREKIKKVGCRAVAKQLALLSDRKSLSPLRRRRNANPVNPPTTSQTACGGTKIQEYPGNPLSGSTPADTAASEWKAFSEPLVDEPMAKLFNEDDKSSSPERLKNTCKSIRGRKNNGISRNVNEVQTDGPGVQDKVHNRSKWNTTAYLRARFIEQGRMSKDDDCQSLPSPRFSSRSRSGSLGKSKSSPPTPR